MRRLTASFAARPAAVLALLLAACAAPATPPDQRPAPSVTATQPLGASSSALSAGPAQELQGTQPDDWPTYHLDSLRHGSGPASPVYDRVQQAWSAPLDGEVYAEPLVAGGMVIVVTENDTVYALDVRSGGVLWSQHLGDPVRLSSLPCGNIDPSGITSTPVLDVGPGVVYVAGRFQPTHHELVALDLASGNVIFRRTVDPPGADPRYLQQRGALGLANGRVYVPFGGNLGDCGPYKGWVVSSATDGSGDLQSYGVPTQREGAIWAAAGFELDSDGTLVLATGNADSTTTFDYGNAVIRLSPDLQPLDYWAPADWAALSRRDLDIGSIAPLLIDNDLVFQTGKTGVGYLLRASHLGGVGGELFSSQMCSGAFGGSAYQAPYIYVPCTDGLVALQVNGDAFSIAWHATQQYFGAPIVANGWVWAIDFGAGQLVQIDSSNGAVHNSYALGSITAHFITPTASNGLILAPAGHGVMAFGPAS